MNQKQLRTTLAHPTPELPVADIDATHEELRSRGARIVDPLEQKPWGVRQFTVGLELPGSATSAARRGSSSS